MSFEAALQQGKIGEGLIAGWFRRRGFHVLPVYEKELGTGKGPTLFQAHGEPLIAPDMLAFRSDKTLWIEAKTKSAFTWYRQRQSWDTGIDRRHYEDYLRVADLSPWPVCWHVGQLQQVAALEEVLNHEPKLTVRRSRLQVSKVALIDSARYVEQSLFDTHECES